MTINTAVLPHTGETVAARKDGSPKTFANRTQAENFTRGMAGVEVIRRGRTSWGARRSCGKRKIDLWQNST